MIHFSAKKTILIVQQPITVNNQLNDMLLQKGFNVINQYKNKPVDSFDTAYLVYSHYPVDILVTDINLNDEKDGLMLCSWVKSHFGSMVILWSADNSFENLERARLCKADHFVQKTNSPDFGISQIWNIIFLALPGISVTQERAFSGSFLDVKEVDTSTMVLGYEKRTQGSVYQEKFIRWADVTHIVSYNLAKAGEGNNNLLICTATNQIGYIYRNTLAEIMHQVPDFFVRFDKSTILNLHHITAKGRGHNLFYIGNLQFRLSDIYKDEVINKLEILAYKKF